jgi:hypothetical protein
VEKVVGSKVIFETKKLFVVVGKKKGCVLGIGASAVGKTGCVLSIGARGLLHFFAFVGQPGVYIKVMKRWCTSTFLAS